MSDLAGDRSFPGVPSDALVDRELAAAVSRGAAGKVIDQEFGAALAQGADGVVVVQSDDVAELRLTTYTRDGVAAHTPENLRALVWVGIRLVAGAGWVSVPVPDDVRDDFIGAVCPPALDD